MLKNTYGFFRAHLLWQLTEVVSKWFRGLLPEAPRLTAVRRAARGAGSFPEPDQLGNLVRSWSHAPPVFKASSWRLQLMKTSLICCARHCNLIPNSLFIFSPITFFTKFSTKNITNFTFASLLQFKAPIIIWPSSGFLMPLVPSTVHWIVC